ncbi:competence pheromone ComX [Paenibacillus kobensis]|uniref:competence pheromone ComX n=1 Tax=Paenibacillus kobensis TaxID=59841 RepID=UPI000FDC7CDB|nr:competence pheromone ComX [Paenibacillus kobensis]
MLKELIAQLKQNHGMRTQFAQGNVAFAGVNMNQQQAMIDILKGQETAKEQVRAGNFWIGE